MILRCTPPGSLIDNGFSIARERIRQYANEWRSPCDPRPMVMPCARAGLKPGPVTRRILTRLRAARLDGEISTDDEENRLLDTLDRRRNLR